MRRPDQARRVAAYYDAQTEPFYRRLWDPDDLHLGLFLPGEDGSALKAALKRMTAAVAGPGDFRPGEFVIDAGCGVGGAALDLARDRGCRVLGVTVSPRQVEIASERAHAAGLADRVEFVVGDCSDALPARDGTVDAVLTIEAACHFADRPRFLAECRRVMRPGGRLLGSDWWTLADALGDPDRRRAYKAMDRAWHLAGMETAASWAALLAGAGFEHVETEDFGPAIEENARLMLRTYAAFKLRADLGIEPDVPANQLLTLGRAWRAGAFTVGRFLGRSP